jgi:hypothetical protein
MRFELMEANVTGSIGSHSKYDPFLYEIVVEGELPVSVLSMLTRLNLDPWAEAARLSQLPKHEAARSLSARIQQFECSSIAYTEADELASRLIERLPARETLVAQAMHHEKSDFMSLWLIFAIFFAMMSLSQKAPAPDKDAQSPSVVTQRTETPLLHHDGVRKHDRHSVPAIHVQP